MAEPAEIKPIHILLVEDNPGDARLVVEALRESKVSAAMSIARDGLEALDVLHQRPPFEKEPRPDLILLDLGLPRMDGREFLDVIHKSSDFRRIPVVILTLSSAREDIVQAYKHHVSCFITKPVDIEQFVNIVQSIDDLQFSAEEEAMNG
jgi:CheY-like chemotaxis protein